MRLIDLFRKQVPATDEVGLEPATAGVPGAGGSDALVARSAGRTCRFGHEDATAAAGLSGQGDADFCSPFEFATSMRTASGLEFDVMLESKVKDLALIRLRPDMLRYAEDVASRFGLTPTQAPALESEQAALLEEQAASGALSARKAPPPGPQCPTPCRATEDVSTVGVLAHEVIRWRSSHPWPNRSPPC